MFFGTLLAAFGFTAEEKNEQSKKNVKFYQPFPPFYRLMLMGGLLALKFKDSYKIGIFPLIAPDFT